MRFLLFILIAIISSCGIPEYGYIERPTIPHSDKESIEVNFSTDEFTNGFVLYGRYYYYDSNSKEFTYEDYSDSKTSDSLSYLTNKGFSELHYRDELENEVELELSGSRDELKILNNQLIVGQEQSVTISVNKSSEFYVSVSKTINDVIVTHSLGDFESEEDIKIVKSFTGSADNDDGYIQIEFAIMAKGVKIDPIPENLYSEPVYLGSFKLKK